MGEKEEERKKRSARRRGRKHCIARLLSSVSHWKAGRAAGYQEDRKVSCAREVKIGYSCLRTDPVAVSKAAEEEGDSEGGVALSSVGVSAADMAVDSTRRAPPVLAVLAVHRE